MNKYTTVDEFLDDQSPEKLAQINRLRTVILTTEPSLTENVKWNAPNYVFGGEDRLTFNLMNKEGIVKLVLHMGSSRKEDKKGAPIMSEDQGIVEWSSDIRGVIRFKDLDDVIAKERALRVVIMDWLSLPS